MLCTMNFDAAARWWSDPSELVAVPHSGGGSKMTLVCSVSPCYIQYYKQHNETSRTIFCTAPKDHCCSSAWNQACGALLFYLQYKTLPSIDAQCPLCLHLCSCLKLAILGGLLLWTLLQASITLVHTIVHAIGATTLQSWPLQGATKEGGGAVKKGAATTQALHSSKLNSIKLKLRSTSLCRIWIIGIPTFRTLLSIVRATETWLRIRVSQNGNELVFKALFHFCPSKHVIRFCIYKCTQIGTIFKARVFSCMASPPSNPSTSVANISGSLLNTLTVVSPTSQLASQLFFTTINECVDGVGKYQDQE